MNKYYWISFADTDKPKGSQFIGACIVPAINVETAIPVSWLLGCNPGGEALIIEIPEEGQKKVTPEVVGVILSKDYIEKNLGGVVRVEDL